MVCSIFIASITASGWPCVTAWPGCARKAISLPGIGAVSRPPSATLSPACAMTSYSSTEAAPSAANTLTRSPVAYTVSDQRRWPNSTS